MRTLIYCFLIMLIPFASIGKSSKPQRTNLIPQPTSVEWKSGGFNLKNGITIYADNSVAPIAGYLKDILKKGGNVATNVKAFDANAKGGITLSLVDDSQYGDQGYRLDVSAKGIEVKAKTAQGLFNSVATIHQLIPVSGKMQIPAVSITDKPQFVWREMMLDVGRHFFSKDEVKRYIELGAMYKFNVFHWHLTEDQGWRIEIKKYPKLAEVAAWRTEADGKRYGGFYTQEDIKEVVAFAASRGVTIIPEIELPGHSVAALAAYPELSCTGGSFEVPNSWGVFPDVYCAGNDKTFTFLQDVLTEVMALFPGKYIHIGGDECPKDRWEKCPKCQQRIKDNGLKNEHELQSYFVKRIEKFLNDNGRKLIGWDEILEGGLAPNATVQLWRDWDHAVKAAEEGHDVIMTPTTHCYFDYLQKNLDLEKVYSFNPIPEKLAAEHQKHILGGGANLWTERVPNSDRADFMLFPRLFAISECLWNGKARPAFNEFLEKVRTENTRLEKLGVKYGPEGRDFDTKATPDIANRQLKVAIKSDLKDIEFRYSVDASVPTTASPLVKNGEFSVKDKATITISAFRNGKTFGSPVFYNFNAHKAFGSPVKIKNPLGSSYKGLYNDCITDGLKGSPTDFRDGFWQGTPLNDFVADVELPSVTEVRSLSLNAFQDVGSWIFFPVTVVYEVSEDGVKYTPVASAQVPLKSKTLSTYDFKVTIEPVKAKFIRVTAKNIGLCPQDHSGKGNAAWVFVDELTVE